LIFLGKTTGSPDHFLTDNLPLWILTHISEEYNGLDLGSRYCTTRRNTSAQ